MLAYLLTLIDDPSDCDFFDDIYSSFQKQMLGVANKILHDEYLAEDAVQNAFERIAKNIKTVRNIEDYQVKTYLLTAAKNAAIDIIKKNREFACENISPIEEHFVDDEIIKKENLSFVLKMIDNLPQKYRDVLYYRYVMGLSTKEMSHVLNISANTLRQQHARGKKMLTEQYNREMMKLEK